MSETYAPYQIQIDFGLLAAPAEMMRIIDERMRSALWDEFLLSKSIAESATLFRDRTYRLRKSIKCDVTGTFSRDTLEGRLYSEVPYARFVEYGTRAHTILPKHKPFLAWQDAQSGLWRYARRVHHPGTQPRPFLHQAVDEHRIAERMRRALAGG